MEHIRLNKTLLNQQNLIPSSFQKKNNNNFNSISYFLFLNSFSLKKRAFYSVSIYERLILTVFIFSNIINSYKLNILSAY